MSGAAGPPTGGGGGGQESILRVGLDTSGVARGQQEIVRSLNEIKAKVDDMARVLGNAGITDAFNRMARAADFLRNGLVALGVGFAGMRMGEAAMEATMMAARFETLGVVLNRVAQNTNYSALQINQFAMGVEKMGITMAQGRQAIITMIQGQIDLANATKLARLAQDAAVIANTNSSDAMQRLIYGIQSGQTEVLRTLGLNVNFEQSYVRLAASLNKPVEALTNLEKMTARTNSVFEAGIGITGAYESAMETAGKQILSMQRYVEDAQTKFGTLAFLPAFTTMVFQVSNAMKELNTSLDAGKMHDWLQGFGQGLKGIAEESAAVVIAVGTGFGTILVAAVARFVVSLTLVRAALTGMQASMVATFFNPWVLGLTALTTAVAYFLTRESETAKNARLVEEALKRQAEATGGVRKATEELTQAEKNQAEQRAREQVRKAQQDLASLQQVQQQSQAAIAGRSRFMPMGSLSGASYGDINAAPAAADSLALAMARLQHARDVYAASDHTPDAAKRLMDTLAAQDAALGANNKGWNKATADLRTNLTTVIDSTKAIEGQTRAIRDAEAALVNPGQRPFDINAMQQDVNRALGKLGMIVGAGGTQVLPQQLSQHLGLSQLLQGQMAEMESELDRNLAARTKLFQQSGSATGEYLQKLRDAKAITDEITALQKAWPDILRAAGNAVEDSITKAMRGFNQQAELAGARTPQERAAVSARQAWDNLMRTPDARMAIAQRLGMVNAQGVPQPDQLTEANVAGVRSQFIAGSQAASLIEQQRTQHQATQEAEIRAKYARQIAEAEANGPAAVRRVTQEMDRQLELNRTNSNLLAQNAKFREDEARAIGGVTAKIKEMEQANDDARRMADARLQGSGAVAQEQLRQYRRNLERELGVGAAAATAPAPVSFAGATGTPYASNFADAEGRYGLPPGLLASIAWKESRFNANAINQQSGAAGMMQIMPGTAAQPGYGVRPIENRLDPAAAIDFAGAYIQALARQFGSLAEAVKRYSHGGYGLGDLQRAPTGGGPAANDNRPVVGAQEQADTVARGTRARAGELYGQMNDRLTQQVESQKQELEVLGAESRAWGATNAQRQLAIDLMKLQIQEEKDLSAVVSDTADKTMAQQRAEIDSRYAQLRGIAGQTAALRDQIEVANQLRSVGQEVGQAFSSSLERAMQPGAKFKDIMGGLAKDLENIAFRTLVAKPLENMMGSLFTTGSLGLNANAPGGIFGLMTQGFGKIGQWLTGGDAGAGGAAGSSPAQAAASAIGAAGSAMAGGAGRIPGLASNMVSTMQVQAAVVNISGGVAGAGSNAGSGTSLLSTLTGAAGTASLGTSLWRGFSGETGGGGHTLGADMTMPGSGWLSGAWNWAKGLFGGSMSGIESAGSLGASSVAGLPLQYRRGGAFDLGNVVAFAGGGVVGSPSLFSLAGGRTGLMGEAGPEGVLPLQRTRDGRLGVAAAGFGGSGQNITFNIQTPDADSFGRSQGQIMSRAAAALGRANARG